MDAEKGLVALAKRAGYDERTAAEGQGYKGATAVIHDGIKVLKTEDGDRNREK